MMQQQPQQHLLGWRVKLYRLNDDGSLNDCGTGMIQFYYASPRQQQQQQQRDTIFHMLGEPMLRICNEISNIIMLRVPVLILPNTYQRSEGRVISWSQQFNHDNIDFSLSFADDEGRNDIWQNIMNIQALVLNWNSLATIIQSNVRMIIQRQRYRSIQHHRLMVMKTRAILDDCNSPSQDKRQRQKENHDGDGLAAAASHQQRKDETTVSTTMTSGNNSDE